MTEDTHVNLVWQPPLADMNRSLFHYSIEFAAPKPKARKTSFLIIITAESLTDVITWNGVLESYF